jgi:hypothetical protein
MVELAHAYVEQTTEQTHTGDTNWTDISGAVIPSGSFTVGQQYLIMISAQVSGNSTSGNFGHKLVHNVTDFADSDMTMEFNGNTNLYAMTYTFQHILQCNSHLPAGRRERL